MATIEEKVETLESILGQFIVHTDTALRRLEKEMREFKEEMRLFKSEMEEFKEEMLEFKDEMKGFKDEMSKFKDNIEKYIKKNDETILEIKEEQKKKNREWSDLAKKMGTIVEDLISPALGVVLSKYFNCEAKMEGQRMRKRKDGETMEIDGLVASDDYVFMIEVRSTPRVAYVDDIFEKSKQFFKFFPEYKDKKLVVIFGGITFPEEVIKYTTKKRIYVMGWREWEYMDILNFEEVKKAKNK